MQISVSVVYTSKTFTVTCMRLREKYLRATSSSTWMLFPESSRLDHLVYAELIAPSKYRQYILHVMCGNAHVVNIVTLAS